MLADEALKQYFLNELGWLRGESTRFAADYPDIAGELSLGGERSPDPHMEMLLQSFAFLTGNLRYQMDLDDAHLPNQLLAALNPHLEQPWPCMSIARYTVDPDGANFANVNRIPKGALMNTDLKRDEESAVCRFQARADCALWPIDIQSIQSIPASRFDFLHARHDVQSVLRVRLRSTDGHLLSGFPLTELCFHLYGEQRFSLYDDLYGALRGVALATPDNTPYALRDRHVIHFEGLGTDAALLPGEPAVNAGLTLLREYFHFPEKFLFFTVKQLAMPTTADDATTGNGEQGNSGQVLDLLLLLDTPARAVDNDALQLNCVPVVNLFRQAIEPLRLQANQMEYPLSGDQFHHQSCEVHSLLELQANRADSGTVKSLYPLYGDRDSSDGYWVTRREPSQLPSVPGTELYVRFVNGDFVPEWPDASYITGRAWCSNRRVAEHIPVNALLQMENPGPAQTARLLRRPTRHRVPALTGDQSRRLVMQLNNHYLPLQSGPQGLRTVKNLLREHAQPLQAQGQRQLDGLLSMHCEMIGQHIRNHRHSTHWGGQCHGTLMTLTVDTHCFDQVSVLLFGTVLNECLAHFVPLNSFVQLRFCNPDGELIHQWQARAGSQWPL